MTKLGTWLIALGCAWVCVAVPAAAEGYDLVILGGRVMDPASGLDAVRNVGVRDGKIAAITEQPIGLPVQR
jgi:hypothetical protein